MFFYEDQFISETLSDTQFFFKLTIFLVLTNVNSILSVTHETIFSLDSILEMIRGGASL
jgi:hypothetical protein